MNNENGGDATPKVGQAEQTGLRILFVYADSPSEW